MRKMSRYMERAKRSEHTEADACFMRLSVSSSYTTLGDPFKKKNRKKL